MEAMLSCLVSAFHPKLPLQKAVLQALICGPSWPMGAAAILRTFVCRRTIVLAHARMTANIGELSAGDARARPYARLAANFGNFQASAHARVRTRVRVTSADKSLYLDYGNRPQSQRI
jgi:hypothetical protein